METISIGYLPSPVGKTWVAASVEGLHMISMGTTEKAFRKEVASNYPGIDIVKDQKVLANPVSWLEDYFSGKSPSLKKLNLKPTGTAFREKVWKALAKVPYGQLVTYGDLAKKVNCGSARAIGQAVGHNPLPIVIPCHRVVAANGKLGGFSSGIEKKTVLLALEGHKVDTKLNRIS